MIKEADFKRAVAAGAFVGNEELQRHAIAYFAEARAKAELEARLDMVMSRVPALEFERSIVKWMAPQASASTDDVLVVGSGELGDCEVNGTPTRISVNGLGFIAPATFANIESTYRARHGKRLELGRHCIGKASDLDRLYEFLDGIPARRDPRSPNTSLVWTNCIESIRSLEALRRISAGEMSDDRRTFVDRIRARLGDDEMFKVVPSAPMARAVTKAA
jgi:hypothetical protein